MASNATLYNLKSQLFPRGHALRPLQLSMYTPVLHDISGCVQTHTHTHTHTHTACMHAHHVYTQALILLLWRRPHLSIKISLEWSKMPLNATLHKLKAQIFPGGHAPDPPGFIGIYTTALHVHFCMHLYYNIISLHCMCFIDIWDTISLKI